MDRFDDDTLFAELRELRPTPRPKFTADLDVRAAAGFPRGEGRSAAPFTMLANWWRGLNSRRRLVPALGFALTILAVATVVVAASHSVGGGSVAESLDGRNGTVHAEVESQSLIPEAAGGAAVGGAESAEGSAAGRGAEESSSGSVETGSAAGAEESESYLPALQNVPKVHATTGFTSRDIERSSYIVLGTKPGQVSGAAAKVYEAVHAADGVVLHSSVQSGSSGATGASFDLLIPSAKLNDTLAALSSIAEVRRRHDASNDITAPTVSAAEELADSNATIDGLLKELADTGTEAERESVEARLREERHLHAAIRASLDHLHQRASMSEVTLRIVTGKDAGVTPPAKGGDSWGVGDALHDAGHLLTIAAGVLLIGLAVLAPFALFALVFWAGNRFRVRRLRERTLS